MEKKKNRGTDDIGYAMTSAESEESIILIILASIVSFGYILYNKKSKFFDSKYDSDVSTVFKYLLFTSINLSVALITYLLTIIFPSANFFICFSILFGLIFIVTIIGLVLLNKQKR